MSEGLPPWLQGSKEDVLLQLAHGSEPGSVLHGQMVAGITVKSVQDVERAFEALEEAIASAASASDRLGHKLFWLNVVLAAATAVGAFAAIWSAFS